MFGKSDTDKEGDRVKKERKENLKSRVSQYKPLWDPMNVIQYKDDYCAILQRAGGERVEFLIAFSDLTKEGYRLVAQDKGSQDIGLNVTKNITKKDTSYYYFQKIEYVTK